MGGDPVTQTVRNGTLVDRAEPDPRLAASGIYVHYLHDRQGVLTAEERAGVEEIREKWGSLKPGETYMARGDIEGLLRLIDRLAPLTTEEPI
jgi:hypothetical protein